MKRAVIRGFGSFGKIELIDEEIPKINEDQVLVKVIMSALNYADILQREGLYYKGPKPPFYPGIEGAGIVVKKGRNVGGLETNSLVCFVTEGGSFSSYAAVNARHCFVVPAFMDARQAAAFLVSGLSAYHSLFAASAKATENILIHSGGGSFGLAAIQIAAVSGLNVYATCSERKMDHVIKAGARQAFTYENFTAQMKTKTGGTRPDIIVDPVGGDLFAKNITLLQNGGRIVLVGFQRKVLPKIDPVKLVYGSKSIIGFHLNNVFLHAELLEQSIVYLTQWVRQKKYKVYVDKIFPLQNIADAYDRLKNRKNIGKVLISLE